jgi:hypothetical protein
MEGGNLPSSLLSYLSCAITVITHALKTYLHVNLVFNYILNGGNYIRRNGVAEYGLLRNAFIEILLSGLKTAVLVSLSRGFLFFFLPTVFTVYARYSGWAV